MRCANCSAAMTKPYWASWDADKPIRKYHCASCGWEGESVEVWRDVAQRQAFQASLFRVIADNGAEDENPPQT